MDRHKYEALQSTEHIRIITLFPSKDPSAPLQCSIQQVKLDNEHLIDYECISYAWGVPVFSHQLLCDDGTVFNITANLHSALTRFRRRDRLRLLWADSVTIDQTNVAEKSAQVPLMARIYHSATRVLVWLGDSVNGESQSMLLLSQLTRMSSVLHEHAGSHGSGIRKEIPALQDLDRIQRFIKLPWFSRRWIIQEVVLNTDVLLHCGDLTMSWSRFVLALEILARYLDQGLDKLAGLASLLKIASLWRSWSLFDREQKDCELLDLLDAFHHFECAEPKDILFALVGLGTDVRMTLDQDHSRPGMRLITDYTLTLSQVFGMFAVERMRTGRLFSTLVDAAERGRLSQETEHVPTWAPDLMMMKQRASKSKHDILPASINRIESTDYKILALNVNICKLNKLLDTRLNCLCTEHLGPIGTMETNIRNGVHQIVTWVNYFVRSEEREVSVDVWRLALFDFCQLLFSEPDEGLLMPGEEILDQLLAVRKPPYIVSSENLVPLRQALSQFALAMNGRRLFRGFAHQLHQPIDGILGDNDHFWMVGIGPAGMQKGDVTIALPAAGTDATYLALALRPLRTNVTSLKYHLIGQAHIRGFWPPYNSTPSDWNRSKLTNCWELLHSTTVETDIILV